MATRTTEEVGEVRSYRVHLRSNADGVKIQANSVTYQWRHTADEQKEVWIEFGVTERREGNIAPHQPRTSHRVVAAFPMRNVMGYSEEAGT